MVDPNAAVAEGASTLYTKFASAWNTHTDALGSVDHIRWDALAALGGGALLAVLLLWMYNSCFGSCLNRCERTRCRLQWPVVVLTAPDADRLPYLRPTEPGGSRFASGIRKVQPKVRATYTQWIAMRDALGPKVPDKDVYNLLQKHGDDVRAACDDFYGTGSF